ncbi:hypothetical protein COX84_04035, partial [Candidatus Micrarchaeota archaeon CG_4_10_14_0_2_um_filter_49_7]
LRAFHLRVKISSAVSADLLLEKFSMTAVIDSTRMLIHALWLFAKSDIALLIGANLPKAV